VESWFDCASGGNNGIVLEVYIAFNPSANLPVWMGQGSEFILKQCHGN